MTHAGIIVSIEISGNEAKLIMHDAKPRSGRPEEWQSVRLYTETLLDATLSPKAYEDIGFNLVNRLRALARSSGGGHAT